MDDIKRDKWKSNPFAKKMKDTMKHHELDRQARGSHVPKNMRRDAINKLKK